MERISALLVLVVLAAGGAAAAPAGNAGDPRVAAAGPLPAQGLLIGDETPS